MLTNNPTQMDSYNKHAKVGQGIAFSTQAHWWRTGSSSAYIDNKKAMVVH